MLKQTNTGKNRAQGSLANDEQAIGSRYDDHVVVRTPANCLCANIPKPGQAQSMNAEDCLHPTESSHTLSNIGIIKWIEGAPLEAEDER